MAMAVVTDPVVSAQENGKENTIAVSPIQTDKDNGHDSHSVARCGLKFNIGLSGVTKVELESVDGNPLAGTANIKKDAQGNAIVEGIENASTIITFSAATPSGFTPGKVYYISTLPCDLYGGYRLSFYKDGLVAHYFGVHQTVKPGTFISPDDLTESELEFDTPDAPLVEKDRPKMDSRTHNLKHMQDIVDEMVQNRDTRIQQQFLRFIDPRRDDNPDDAWMILRGASAPNAFIGHTPVTNAEYAAFKTGFVYDKGKENYPVVDISIKDAEAYCNWLTARDPKYTYRLPSEEEWILAAGHMPKDVSMNSGNAKSGLTAVDAYNQSKGACGGIDFWGNCWEWTSSTTQNGLHIIKGGSWDSDRDDCRSEKSDVVRNGSQGYANVGFRVVRVDSK